MAENDSQSIGKLRVTAQEATTAITTAQVTSETAHSALKKNQEDVAAIFIQVKEDETAIAEAKKVADVTATAMKTVQAQVAETAVKVQSDATTIEKREAESKTALQSIADVTTVTNNTHKRVQDYEQALAALKNEFDELKDKIESLLPGATSAGLASAFREQKARFNKPQRNWLGIFIAAVVSLLAAGLIGLPTFQSGNTPGEPSWDAILRHIVNRLPLVGPLIWLGIYAGRNYMLALRMQEEYAFKEALSATFEGYKREMAAIDAPAESVAPLLTLCENVLRSLAERPGRIYEGKHEDITPLAPVTKALAEVAAKVTEKVGDTVSKKINDMKLP